VEHTLAVALTFAVSAAIGLLVGIERERNPTAKAGLRTFALIAVLGNGCALAAQLVASPWLLAVGFALVGVTLIGAYHADPAIQAEDSGTTTVIAALVVYLLGALNFHGERTLAVALGIGVTALLYFKTELEGVATRLTPTDLRSMLQFGAISAIALPLLPDHGYGPYGVLNPFHIWTMVVLISGVSLAGYVAWRLTLGGKGLLLTGLLGGVISSTATTFAYARHARDATHTPSAALTVILLANVAKLLRVLLLPALAATVPALWWHFRRAGGESGEASDRLQNPTQLGAALLFGAFYALVLLAAAWLSDVVGSGGLFVLSFVSGLTDVDAITLSSARLAEQGNISLPASVTAITLAVGANMLFKAGVSFVVGGRAVGRLVALAFAWPLAAMIGALVLLDALA
jgi:uncharacterized membrane protein (DUF4010 family)